MPLCRRPSRKRSVANQALILAAASAAGALSDFAWAGNNTFTFTAGDTSWSNSSAWLFGGPYPNGFSEIANFTAVDLAPLAPLQVSVTLDLSVTLGTLIFSDTNSTTPGGWILTPGGLSTLTMDAGGSRPIITVNTLGNNASVSFVDMQVPIYGNAFTKNGAGLLRLNAANQFSGSLNINAGTLEVANLANLSVNSLPTIQLSGGTLSLRSDTLFDLSSKTLLVTGNSGLNVNRSAINTSSTVSGLFDSVGTVIIGSGSGSLNVLGGNNFGVNIGTLVLDAGNTAAVLNELAPGQLTIGNVITPNVSAPTTLTFSGTGTNTSGANLTVANSIKQTAPAAALSVVYSDTHQLTVGSFDALTGNLIVSSNGTLLVNAGKLPTGSLGVQSGTLDFSTTNQDSTVTHLVLGGVNNNAGGYINSGSGGTLNVAGNVTFSSSTNGLGATIDGRLNLGSGLHSLQINGIGNIPTQEVALNAITNGTGTLVKSGSGQILLTNANNLTAAVVINQGTISGAARASGNALTAGAVTLSGGTLRLVNQTASAGTGSIGALDFNGAATNPVFLVVDSGPSNATTSLKIGNFLGRVSGTTGALTIIPRNGGLDSTEAIFAGSIDTLVGPAQNHGILAPYVVAQANASNSSIDFLGTIGTAPDIRIRGGGAVYKTDNINNYSGGTAVFAAINGVGNTTLTSSRSIFSLKADGTLANVAGAGQTLTIGNGTLAGLIVNNGANVTVSNLVVNAAEAVFWAGGQVLDTDGTTVLAAGGTISSNLSFASTTQGGLTTSGAQTLNLTGGFNLGGVNRTVTVSNGTTIFSGALSNGNLTKAGPNYLILNGNNGAYGGALTVTTGTLQIGQGTLTSAATLGASTSVTLDNGNLVLNLDGQRSLGNFITKTDSGTGGVIVDSPTGILSFTNGTSNFTSLTIQSGNVRSTNNNQIPSAATLTVTGTGSIDLNGFSQAIGALNGGTNSAGTGVITNSSGIISTLTINRSASDTSTYNGVIRDGVAAITLNKLGIGTQILAGSNGFTGGTRIVAGVLQVNNNTSAGTGSIQMLGGTLALNGTTNLSNQISIGSSTGTIAIVPGANTGTLTGPILVNGGTLAAVYSGNNGTISVNAAGLSSANFSSGTVAFFSTGSGTGSFRLPQSTNARNVVFNFGTAGVQMVLNNVATLGTVLGGNNASFAASGTVAIGDAGGTSTFGGAINSNLNKVGLGTFIVSSATPKNHGMGSVQIRGGALVFGQNARLTSNTLIVNVGTYSRAPGGDAGVIQTNYVAGAGGALYFTGDANFTGNATVNLTTAGKWDVTGVPGGYSGAPGLTIQGSGFIAGAYNHNAGTFMPGGAAQIGTITFNTPANPSVLSFGTNGSVQFDFTTPGLSNIGGGKNDLIDVNGDVVFNPNTLYRFNYIGAGNVAAGDDYPLLRFTGGSTGWGTGGSISTVAGQVSSAFRGAQFVLKAVSPGVIAAHLNSVTINPEILTWTGTQNQRWDLNLSANFKNAGSVTSTFFQGDSAVFDDSAKNSPTIAVERAVFLPAAIIVNNGSNQARIISIGNAAGTNPINDGLLGTFSGNMKLVKNGTGQLNIGNWNTYTGGVELNGGTLNVNNGSWIERLFDHIAASGAGVGPITFNSVAGVNDASLTNGSGNTVSNDLVFPAGKTGNMVTIGNQQYLLGPMHGTGTVQFWGTGQFVLRNAWDDFHGTAVVRSTAAMIFDGPYALGTDVNWQFPIPSTVNFSWKYDFHGADGGAVDIDLGQLNGTANFNSAGTGRRYGILHIGNTNTDSVWKGNSRDFSLTRRAGYMGVTKEGTGSLIMTGSHGYTGDTTVNGGVTQLSNTGGAGDTGEAGRGQMTGTRKVLVRGGTFRLGTIGGGILAGNAGTITTAVTGLLLSADSGGTIDVSNAYDADEIFDNTDPNFPVLIGYGAFKTAAGVTWAGNGGNVLGTVRHESGTISPGKDSGAGSFGNLNFVNTLKLRGGTVMVDIGSTTSDLDTISADTLDINGGTMVVNVVGGSAGTNSIYQVMTGTTQFINTSPTMQLVLKGRGASGTLQTGGPGVGGIQLKILNPGTGPASIMWNGGNGGTWDVRNSQSWVNGANAPDFFYHGDAVTFTDFGAGSIALASNLMPSGEVRVNNSGTNTWSFGGNGGIGGSVPLHKMGTGTLRLLGTNTYSGGTTIDAGGTLTVGADNQYLPGLASAVGTINSAMQDLNNGGQAGVGSIVNNGYLVFGGSEVMVIKNDVSGSGAVYFRDTGANRIDSQLTHTGGTTIESGGIILGRDNALPTNGVFSMVNNGSINTAVVAIGAGVSNQASVETSRLDLHGYAQTILELNSFGVGSNTVIMSSDLGHTSIATLTIGRTGPGGFGGTIRQDKDLDNGVSCMVALTKMSDGTPGGGVATINSSTIGAQATYHYAYAGRTNINAGTFIYIGQHEPGVRSGGDLNIAHTFGTYTVAKGAALGGTFSIRTHVDMQKGSILAPGYWSGAYNVAGMDFLSLDSDTLGSGTNSTQIKLNQYGAATDQVNVLWENGLTFPTLNSVTQIKLNVLAGGAGTFLLIDYSGGVINDLASRFTLNVTNPGTFNYSLFHNPQSTELDLLVMQPIVNTTWQVDNSGTWGTGTNWTTNPTTPNALGSTVNFDSITSPRTVTMDDAYNIGTANFTTAAGFTIGGTNATTLTFGDPNPTAKVMINVTQGSHVINVPVAWNNDGTINIVDGAQLSIGGDFGLRSNANFSGHNVTKDGVGTLAVDSVRNVYGNDGTATLRVKQGTLRMLHHTIANSNSSRVNSLTIDSSAKLDLSNNSLVIDYTGVVGSTIVTQLRGWLKPSDGRLFSSDADGIHGLGYRDNADAIGAGNKPVGNFAGVTVDVSSILVRYTYLGDTNVDEQVDINDLYNLASNYNPSHAGPASAIWQRGDFNYDGYVDNLDLTKLATNWQQGVGNPLGSGLGSDLGPLLTSLGLPNVAVPEPAMVGMMGLGLTGLMARRRRRI